MTARLRALCPEPENFSARGLDEFGRIFALTATPMTQDQFEAEAPGFEVLLIRLHARVPGSLIRSSPRLRLILSPTTGVDHIDLSAASDRGVQVITLRGETAFLREVSSTAELTWALLLALVRRLPAALESTRQGAWQQTTFRGTELRGKTLGIIGLGRLGTMVSRYGGAFGMRVLASDPAIAMAPAPVERMVALPELLAESDVISVHVPLNPQTRHLISSASFDLMKRSAILLNTSRGAIVDDQALARALAAGRIAGAAVDVLADESPAGRATDVLLEYARTRDNLLITPHIGGACEEAIAMTDLFIAGRAAAAIETT